MMEKKAIFLLAAFAAILILLNQASPALYWDENTYLANARGHISDSKYTEEFRFPLLSVVIAAVWGITGESLPAAKLIVILFSAICGLIMYKTAEALLDRKMALLATVLFCTNFLVLRWGFRVYTDIPGLMLLLTGFYLFIRKEGLIWRCICGGFIGAAFLMRFTYGIFLAVILSIGLFSVVRNRKLKDLNRNLAILLGFVLVIMPWLIYNWVTHGNMLWNLIQQYNIVGSSQAWQPVALQILNLFMAFGPMILLSILSLYYIFAKKEGRMYVPALFFSAHLLYILFFVSTKDARYIIPILPFGIMCALYATQHVRKRWQGGIIWLLVIFSVISGGIGVWQSVQEGKCMKGGSLLQSIDYIGAHASADDAIISNVWPWYGHYNNLEAHSMWSRNLASEIARYHADYVIYHDTIGERHDLAGINSTLKLEKKIEGCDGAVEIYST